MPLSHHCQCIGAVIASDALSIMTGLPGYRLHHGNLGQMLRVRILGGYSLTSGFIAEVVYERLFSIMVIFGLPAASPCRFRLASARTRYDSISLVSPSQVLGDPARSLDRFGCRRSAWHNSGSSCAPLSGQLCSGCLEVSVRRFPPWIILTFF